jgi:iron complex outermembrane receptor protein
MKNFKLNPIVTVLLSAGSGVYAQTATLPPVVITANPFSYAVSATDAGTRTNTPIEKIPQSVVVITKDIIDDQGAKTLSDVLRNASNVTAIDERDSNLTGFRVRGFAASTVIDGVQTPGIFHNQNQL